MSEWNVYNKNCPTRMVLDRIADKWTILLVGALATETKRFSELKKELDGISQKMLTQTLRALERDGVVSRKVYPSVPPKVEYSLTALGNTLVELLDGIAKWSENNIASVLESQKAYDARPDKT